MLFDTEFSRKVLFRIWSSSNTSPKLIEKFLQERYKIMFYFSKLQSTLFCICCLNKPYIHRNVHYLLDTLHS